MSSGAFRWGKNFKKKLGLERGTVAVKGGVAIVKPGEFKEKTDELAPVGEAEREYTRADLLKGNIKTFFETTEPVALFLHKLRLCSILFDWYDNGNPQDVRAKDVKRQQLLELVEYIGKNKEVFTPEVLEATVQMVATNLFRPLPPKLSETGSDAGYGDDEPVFDPAWPHLQIVYEFFLRFIVASDVDIKTLKRYINTQFVLRLLALFDSEDHRERDYLKTILHRIYAKFMALRAFIRKAINNVFFVFIYETQRHNGIAELLEILGSIINGFALPLKAEHKNFLQTVLTPMHKVAGLNAFHQHLSYCITQFVDKDPTLAVPVLSGLIKYWPVTNSTKEVLFLNELEELLELTQVEEFKILLEPLFRQISRSIGSAHFQVAERALFLWHNEIIAGHIAANRQEILPIIYPVLHENSENHWNLTVKNLTYNVLKIFMELDQENGTIIVEQCQKNYLEQKVSKETRLNKKKDIWTNLDNKYKRPEEKKAVVSNGSTATNATTKPAAGGGTDSSETDSVVRKDAPVPTSNGTGAGSPSTS
eukprot:gb/GEZN01004364.1/.p1 GENE.gb/GEZN01004364.1/~~gb/GEZN01004364.1/.p1  ORF type:complete len:536 (-),score=95.14 gb/GEZN01004364.1/:295-1902(-)